MAHTDHDKATKSEAHVYGHTYMAYIQGFPRQLQQECICGGSLGKNPSTHAMQAMQALQQGYQDQASLQSSTLKLTGLTLVNGVMKG